MGKIITTLIDKFNGGLSEDHRIRQSNRYGITKHFDVFTYPKKLVPHYKTESGLGAATEEIEKTYGITRFLYAPSTSDGAGEYRLFGYGLNVGEAGLAAIYSYDINGSLDTPGWNGANVSGGAGKWESGSGVRMEDVFFYYKNFIYFWAGRYLQRYDTTGATDLNETYYDTNDGGGSTQESVAQPVHHPSDDIAYFFHDNFVDKLDGVNAFEPKKVELPSDLRIVAACAFGNYLAIGCIDKTPDNINGPSKSTVFLWDRDSSLTTLTERIDFGTGKLLHLATLDNRLIGIMDNYVDGPLGFKKGKILIKLASGQTTKILNEITTDQSVNTSGGAWVYLPRTTFIRENKLYFPMRADLDGDERNGIWVVDSDGRASLDTVEEQVGADGTYEGIYQTGNMWWIAHSGDGSVSRTDDGSGYSTSMPSIYESLIFNRGDSSLTKKLIGATVMTEPLPSAGQVVLKYRLNEQTAWTTIFTNSPTTAGSFIVGKKYKITTVGTTSFTSIGASANTVGVVFTATGVGSGTGTAIGDLINFDALNIGGVTLPEFKEIQFRIESTGGAVITGLKFKSEFIDKQLY